MTGVMGTSIPPKLPDTTNLVFTRSKNEYKEMRAIAARVKVENKRPPLKKLTMVSARVRRNFRDETHALPRNKTPVPTNDFKS
jgi:hypothetical protein